MSKGDWTRASIQHDNNRFEQAHSLPEGDGLPEGMPLEEAIRRGLMSEALPWTNDCEPTSDGWGYGS
jgi:hypothetical protein